MGNTRDTAFIPEVLEDTVRANFKGKKALIGSLAVVTMASMPLSAKGGDKIEVPYFNLLGDLEDAAEGVPLSVATLPDGSREEASVARAGKAIRLSDWKRMAENFADPYAEYTRQLNEAVGRRWDRALIAAAANTSGLPSSHIIDRYDGSTPVKLSWQFALDGRRPFGDEQEDVVGMVVHSKAYFDLVAEVDSQLRPLHAGPPVDGDIVRVAGVTVAISDRCPIAFPTAPTATGTTPPAVTITGENTLAIDSVRVEITTGGNRGTAVFKYSFDGGLTWSETGVTTAATYEMKLHGMPTGLTLNFATGSAYTNDNVYVSTKPKYTSILLKRGALLLWYSTKPLIESVREPLTDSELIAVNTYYLAHRYKRSAQGTRPGVVQLRHN
jgi:hypothetical protein